MAKPDESREPNEQEAAAAREAEVDRGAALAYKLVEHVNGMGSSSYSREIESAGETWVVSVKLKRR